MIVKISTFLLLFLTGVALCTGLVEVFRDYCYFNSAVKNGEARFDVGGEVEVVKLVHAGKGAKRVAIEIEGYNKWIYLNRGKKSDIEAIPVGSNLQANVYLLRKSPLRRKFLMENVVFGYHVVVGDTVIRDGSINQRRLSRGALSLLLMCAALLAICFIAGFLTIKKQMR